MFSLQIKSPSKPFHQSRSGEPQRLLKGVFGTPFFNVVGLNRRRPTTKSGPLAECYQKQGQDFYRVTYKGCEQSRHHETTSTRIYPRGPHTNDQILNPQDAADSTGSIDGQSLTILLSSFLRGTTGATRNRHEQATYDTD